MLNRPPEHFKIFQADRFAADTWVLLWSQQQGFMHVETVGEMLASHQDAFISDSVLQYIPLAFGSRTTIDKLSEQLDPTMAERYNARGRGQDDFIPWEQLP